MLNCTNIFKAIKIAVETKTSLKCYDILPSEPMVPYVYIDHGFQTKDSTETLLKQNFSIVLYIHEDKSGETNNLYKHIEDLENALNQMELSENYVIEEIYPDGEWKVSTNESTNFVKIEYYIQISFGYKIK